MEPKSFPNRNARQTRMFCTYCKRRNHTVNNSFIRQYDEKREIKMRNHNHHMQLHRKPVT